MMNMMVRPALRQLAGGELTRQDACEKSSSNDDVQDVIENLKNADCVEADQSSNNSNNDPNEYESGDDAGLQEQFGDEADQSATEELVSETLDESQTEAMNDQAAEIDAGYDVQDFSRLKKSVEPRLPFEGGEYVETEPTELEAVGSVETETVQAVGGVETETITPENERESDYEADDIETDTLEMESEPHQYIEEEGDTEIADETEYDLDGDDCAFENETIRSPEGDINATMTSYSPNKTVMAQEHNRSPSPQQPQQPYTPPDRSPDEVDFVHPHSKEIPRPETPPEDLSEVFQALYPPTSAGVPETPPEIMGYCRNDHDILAGPLGHIGPQTPPEPGPRTPTEPGPRTPTEPGPRTPTESGPRTPTEPGPRTPTEAGPRTPTEPRPMSTEPPSADLSFESSTSEECVPPFKMITENEYVSASKQRSSRDKKMVCSCEFNAEDPSTHCTDTCLNKVLMIECNSRCPCGDLCKNKKFQKVEYAQTEPFYTGSKGWGLRADQSITSGDFIMEYCGEVVNQGHFQDRMDEYTKHRARHYYFMTISKDEIIDAHNKGNLSRFINHSCAPNCETQKWRVNGVLRIGFFAINTIKKGEELCFDYQYQRYGEDVQTCYCESDKCRGTLGEKMSDTAKPSPKPCDDKSDTKKTELKKKDNIELSLTKITKEDGSLSSPENALQLSRLMVQSDTVEDRLSILNTLQATSDVASLKRFLNYQGLNIIWSWMVDVMDYTPTLRADCKLAIIKVLGGLPITTKNAVEDSKTIKVLKKWVNSEQSSNSSQTDSSEESLHVESEHIESEVDKLVLETGQALLIHWNALKEVFKIPKKEKVIDKKDDRPATFSLSAFLEPAHHTAPAPKSSFRKIELSELDFELPMSFGSTKREYSTKSRHDSDQRDQGFQEKKRRCDDRDGRSDKRIRSEDNHGDNRPDTRGDNRPDTRGDNRPDTRGDNRPDTRGDNRPDTRGDNRPDTRGDNRPDTRGDNRTDTRGDNRPDTRGDNRPDTRGDNHGDNRMDTSVYRSSDRLNEPVRADNRGSRPRYEDRKLDGRNTELPRFENRQDTPRTEDRNRDNDRRDNDRKYDSNRRRDVNRHEDRRRDDFRRDEPHNKSRYEHGDSFRDKKDKREGSRDDKPKERGSDRKDRESSQKSDRPTSRFEKDKMGDKFSDNTTSDKFSDSVGLDKYSDKGFRKSRFEITPEERSNPKPLLPHSDPNDVLKKLSAVTDVPFPPALLGPQPPGIPFNPQNTFTARNAGSFPRFAGSLPPMYGNKQFDARAGNMMHRPRLPLNEDTRHLMLNKIPDTPPQHRPRIQNPRLYQGLSDNNNRRNMNNRFADRSLNRVSMNRPPRFEQPWNNPPPHFQNRFQKPLDMPPAQGLSDLKIPQQGLPPNFGSVNPASLQQSLFNQLPEHLPHGLMVPQPGVPLGFPPPHFPPSMFNTRPALPTTLPAPSMTIPTIPPPQSIPLNKPTTPPMVQSTPILQLAKEPEKKPKPEPKSDSKLPAHWRTAKDNEGKTYFYHALTRETQWDPPTVEDPTKPVETPASPIKQPTKKRQEIVTSPIKPVRVREQESLHTKKPELGQDQKKYVGEFKSQLAKVVVNNLGKYNKVDCKIGRIMENSDFKYLARKLTHGLTEKEMQRKTATELCVTDSLKQRVKLYIASYMNKFGPIYHRT